MFELSDKSLQKLEGVNDKLCLTLLNAIKLTKIDFGITCGLRSKEEQEKLVQSGASTTMKSKHLIGEAVDVVAYVNGRVSWEINVYDDIAEAIRQSAKTFQIGIRWGAAWSVPDICLWPDTMEEAMLSYIDLKRRHNARPFIDAPHFEIAQYEPHSSSFWAKNNIS